jgi:hypothetical protein
MTANCQRCSIFISKEAVQSCCVHRASSAVLGTRQLGCPESISLPLAVQPRQLPESDVASELTADIVSAYSRAPISQTDCALPDLTNTGWPECLRKLPRCIHVILGGLIYIQSPVFTKKTVSPSHGMLFPPGATVT